MDYSVINQGQYPQKAYWKSTGEKWVFGGMTMYIVLCLFSILAYYTWGGQ